jgi:hypothetical protein
MEEMKQRSPSVSWGRAKVFAGLLALAFAVTLAIVTSNRLSDEALGVLAGAVCGVGAAIPTSLLVVAVSQRKREEQRAMSTSMQAPMHQGGYPPVVVVAPPTSQAMGSSQHLSGWNNVLPPSLTAPQQRQFTVVGGTPIDMERRSHERYS